MNPLRRRKGAKSLDDFIVFRRDISKEVVETLFEGERA